MASPSPWPVTVARRLRRLLPQRRHLRGTFLHSIFGDRLLDPWLWRPHGNRLAAGLALGTFVSLTPTVGLHFILAGFFAFALRANIPAALVACLLVNPVTAPIIYPLEFKLGLLLTGPMPAAVVGAEGLGAAMRTALRYARPLWVGSLLTAIVGGGAAYGVGLLLERALSRLRLRRMRRRRDRRGARVLSEGGSASPSVGGEVVP